MLADDDAYDLGKRRGLYRERHTRPVGKGRISRCGTNIADELPALLSEKFGALDMDRSGDCGALDGGHGALTAAMNLPGRLPRSLPSHRFAHPPAAIGVANSWRIPCAMDQTHMGPNMTQRF